MSAVCSELLSHKTPGSVTSRRVHLTEEAFMASIPKVVGVLTCGCLLGVGLYLNGSHTIKGEVLRVEPSAYFVQEYDGDQVRVHTDGTTPCFLLTKRS